MKGHFTRRIGSKAVRAGAALSMALTMCALPATAQAQQNEDAVQLAATGSVDASDITQLEINRAVSQIPAGASDFDKARVLHDWLVLHCTYDWYTFGHNIPATPSYRAEGAFAYNTAVCSGYALAYKRLCEAAGVDCKLVLSDDHAWNLVRIDGNWYHVDCTWEDGNVPGSVSRDYFLLSDEKLKSKDSSSHHFPFWASGNGKLPEANSTRFDNMWPDNGRIPHWFNEANYTIKYVMDDDVYDSPYLTKEVAGEETILDVSDWYNGAGAIKGVAVFDNGVYYLKGQTVYKVNADDTVAAVKVINAEKAVGLEVEDKCLVCIIQGKDHNTTRETVLVKTSCDHDYNASLGDGEIIDTCILCGQTETYKIASKPTSGGGTAGGSGSTVTPGGGQNGNGSAIGDDNQAGENGNSQNDNENNGEQVKDDQQPGDGGQTDGSDEVGDSQQETTATKLAKPRNVKVKVKGAKATVTWSKVAGAGSYSLAYRTGKGSWKQITLSANKGARAVLKLSKGKTYQVKIRAVAKSSAAAVNGPWSKMVKAKTVRK